VTTIKPVETITPVTTIKPVETITPVMTVKPVETVAPIDVVKPFKAAVTLTDIKGITQGYAAKLTKAGIKDPKALAKATPENVAKILGLRGTTRAEAFIDEAKKRVK